MNFNTVILGGHLTRDPETRAIPSGQTLASFGIAVNSKYGDKESVCFVECTAWAKTGELVAQHFHKGDPILVQGRLDFQTWDDKEGNKRSKHSVTVDRITFVGGGKGKGDAKPAAPAKEADMDEDIPF